MYTVNTVHPICNISKCNVTYSNDQEKFQNFSFLESNEISFLLKSVKFENIQLLLNVKFLNIRMFFFFVFRQITACCRCISADVALVRFFTRMNIFMLIQLTTLSRVSTFSTLTIQSRDRDLQFLKNSVDTLASAESFTTDFTAIWTVICMTLRMNFKIFLQVSRVRTFGTLEDLGFVSMNSLIVLIQSRLSVRFTTFDHFSYQFDHLVALSCETKLECCSKLT